MALSEENYQKGLEILTRLDKENYQAIVDSFKDSPAPEVMIQMIIYAGFPVALNTILTVAKDVFEKQKNIE